MTLQLHAYRSKRPIRRTGCLVAQPAEQLPGFPAGVHLRGWAEQLIAVDRAIDEQGGLLAAEVTAGDLDELQHLIEHGLSQNATTAAADDFQPDRGFLEAARRALAEGDRVYCVATA